MEAGTIREAPEILGSHRLMPLFDGRMVRRAFPDNAASTMSFRVVTVTGQILPVHDIAERTHMLSSR